MPPRIKYTEIAPAGCKVKTDLEPSARRHGREATPGIHRFSTFPFAFGAVPRKIAGKSVAPERRRKIANENVAG